jgi:hypothetical protein
VTDGEKMIWAAAFALEFHRVRGSSPTNHGHCRAAAVFADAAVAAVRFGAPEGEFRNEMVAAPTLLDVLGGG